MRSTKIISSEEVFRSRNFRIEKRVIERKGKQITKDFIISSPTVFILPVTKNKEIYLENQSRDAYEKRMLEVVAGHAEPGEDFLDAAKRELREEAGITAENWYKMALLHPSANIKADIHIFACWDLKIGEAHLDEDEDIEIVKMPLSEALEKAYRGELEIGTHHAALYMLDRLIREKKIVL
jgi:ADP-ribose pyrophosphatase